MHDILVNTEQRKADIYAELLPQIEHLIEGETDLVANLANVAAVLKSTFDFFWVGFYVRKGEQLVLGPFQGPLACTRIDLDKGVCGAAASRQETLLVPDVEQFPGHIACSSLSKSEVVVPLVVDGHCKMVLDVDSDQLADFDEADVRGLEAIMDLVKNRHY